MKDPEGFGVRVAEDPQDPGRVKLKQSILEEPTVVCYHCLVLYLFLSRFEMASFVSLGFRRICSSILTSRRQRPKGHIRFPANTGLIFVASLFLLN